MSPAHSRSMFMGDRLLGGWGGGCCWEAGAAEAVGEGITLGGIDIGGVDTATGEEE